MDCRRLPRLVARETVEHRAEDQRGDDGDGEVARGGEGEHQPNLRLRCSTSCLMVATAAPAPSIYTAAKCADASDLDKRQKLRRSESLDQSGKTTVLRDLFIAKSVERLDRAFRAVKTGWNF
jgi:hypothetical protein